MKVAQEKRGRKSGQEVIRNVGSALKNLQEVEFLEQSSLGRLPAVRQLAETKYRQASFATALALRQLLLQAVRAVMQELGEIPRYQREIEFLQRYIAGDSVAEISRGLGLCREHVSRTIRPRALGLVAKVFLAKASRSEMNGGAGPTTSTLSATSGTAGRGR